MKQNMPRLFSFALSLALIVSFLPVQAMPAGAVSTGIVISQVYGGGGNSGATLKNDFIELYNLGTTAVSLAGWSVQYGSATGNTWSSRTNLTGTIQPGHYFLIQEAAGSGGTMNLPTPDVIGNIFMGASSGKVALVSSTTALTGACPTGGSIVDFVGFGNTSGNTANCSETAPTATLSNITAALRNSNGATDTDNNFADFTVGAPYPRNNLFPFAAIGLATPAMIGSGDTTLLTVTVSPAPDSTGITVACNLSLIGGSSTQPMYDNGTNGDAVAGDNIFSFSTTATGIGTLNLTCTFADTQGRIGTTTITLIIPAILPIGTVNGVISDTTDAPSHNAVYLGQTVIIKGVIFEKTLAPTSTGGTNYGFFIQNTASTADGDPNTSDGLFVYLGSASKIGSYTPTVGDEIILSGKVTEYYNMTELGSPFTVSVVRSGANLDSDVPAFVANPPANLADANRYWERRQGMRGQVPANSIVLNGRNVFSPADAEIWLAGPDSTVALRTDSYERRAFRDAHLLDDNYDPINWDGNGYRILMGSQGIKFTEGDVQALLVPARTFDMVTNAPVGGVNYSFSKYRLEVTTQPVLNEGVDPAANNPPQEFDRSTNYTIVDYNLENLYDFRNNPFSNCDFAGDTNCLAAGTPFLGDVKSPFNYVPASDADYQSRLTDIATQIINDLHSPDILMLQEVENQDICSVVDGSLACGDTNNADGQPDVLQDLALKIATLGGPAYQTAFDSDSSDLRGILPAFMYRSDRVELAPTAGDPLLGGTPAIAYPGASVPSNADISNPKTLNAVLPEGFVGACETSWVFPRAPDIALFRIYSESIGMGSYRDVYAVNNHFKSGPDSCVAHRTEQAKYNAAIVAFLESENPNALVVVGGDLNVYPRPDDIASGASDQLGSLYNTGLGLTNLWEVLLGQAPASAYSYVYLGMAQTLDQMFVTGPLLADLREFRIAHINSDFPAEYPGDVARGTSDHDPNVATFAINFSGFFPPIENVPALNEGRAGSVIPVQFSLSGDKGLDIFAGGAPQSGEFVCDTGDTSGTVFEPTFTAGSSGLTYDPLTDQYTYAWKTDKSWSGTCRQLMVTLIDGTVQLANFQFK